MPDDPTANPDADADSSDATSESSDEEVQTIPLPRSARKNDHIHHATCVILRPGGRVDMKVRHVGGVCNLVISVDCSLNYSHHKYNTKHYNRTKEME